MDCGKLDLAANCYINALDIKHTRAHQGLARVYYLKNQRKAAYDEMTKLIEKAHNSASAYEKRSEYCERETAMDDLKMATQLDPLRTYPYRYRAAGNFMHQFLHFDSNWKPTFFVFFSLLKFMTSYIQVLAALPDVNTSLHVLNIIGDVD